MNHFAPKSAAERYAKGRPDYHSIPIQHIKDFLQLDKKLDKALDIACGTGLSSKALLEIATHVYATDTSPEMLKLAPARDKINYSVAPAEQQPFPDGEFDLITVSSGVHWFDIDNFLKETNRLLKNKAWLVLYENHFIAEMDGPGNLKDWFDHFYTQKFPYPPRNDSYNWTNENLNPKNYNFITEQEFKNAVVYTKPQLILYFTTQSNISWAVSKNETTYEEVENWLDKELVQFFANDEMPRTFYFGNWIKFIQRAS